MLARSFLSSGGGEESDDVDSSMSGEVDMRRQHDDVLDG